MLCAPQVIRRLLEFNDPDAPDFDPKDTATDLVNKPIVWQGTPTDGFHAIMLQRYHEQGGGQVRGFSRQRRDNKPMKATRLELDHDGTVRVRYYHTDVITVKPDGTIIAQTGGHHTVTTAHRMCNFLPDGWSIYRRCRLAKGGGIGDEQLYWGNEGIRGHNRPLEQPLSDGDHIQPDGRLITKLPPVYFRDKKVA